MRDAPPQRPPPLAGRVSARIFVGPLSPLRGESEPTKIRRRTRPSRGKPVRDANPSRQGRGTRSELGRTRPARGGGGLPRPWRDGGLPRPWRDGSAGVPHGLAPLPPTGGGPITTPREGRHPHGSDSASEPRLPTSEASSLALEGTLTGPFDPVRGAPYP